MASDVDKVLVVHDLVKGQQWRWQRREKKLESRRRKIKVSGAGLRDNVKNAEMKRYNAVMGKDKNDRIT